MEQSKEKKTISFTSSIDKRDYRKIAYFNVFFKDLKMLYLIVMAGIASLCVLVLHFTGRILFPDFLIYVCTIFIVLIPLLFLVTEFMVYRFLKSDRLSINNAHQYTIDEEKIVTEGGVEKARAEYLWIYLYKAYEIKDYFLLYINQEQALILPKRNLTEEDSEMIRDLMRKNLRKRSDVRA